MDSNFRGVLKSMARVTTEAAQEKAHLEQAMRRTLEHLANVQHELAEEREHSAQSLRRSDSKWEPSSGSEFDEGNSPSSFRRPPAPRRPPPRTSERRTITPQDPVLNRWYNESP